MRQNEIFTKRDFHSILINNGPKWYAGVNLNTKDFIGFLENEFNLQHIVLNFPTYNVDRYSFKKDVSPYALASSLKEMGYLSHYSAMFLNGLTEQIPTSLYFNYEQNIKENPARDTNVLSQDMINIAFNGNARVTNQVAQYNEYKIYLLNGMHTENLGVVEVVPDDFATPFLTTCIERTLIDIAVRPFYSGGIHEVLKAYRMAAEYVSINKLSAFLEKINYIYPYHQAIGFYLEKSNAYNQKQINILKSFEIKHDFYLTYNITNPKYSEQWKLFYPQDF